MDLLNAWVLAAHQDLLPEDFDIPGGRAPASPDSKRPPSSDRRREGGKRERSALSEHREAERRRILQALESCNWNRVKAADLSGIPRRTFYRRLREYGIQ